MTYPSATELFILADGGGSDGSRPRSWKTQLQQSANLLNFLGQVHASLVEVERGEPLGLVCADAHCASVLFKLSQTR